MAFRGTHESELISAISGGGNFRSTHEALLISDTQPAGAHSFRSTHEALLISVTVPPVGLTYPLTPPAIAGIGPQDFALSDANVVAETESPFTLSQQEQQWQGQRFEIEANLPPLFLSEAEQWVSFLSGLFGTLGTFLMGDYLRQTPQGPMSGSPVVAGTNLNGSNILLVRGATRSVSNWAVAGDYVQVTAAGGQQRIHRVLQNASSDGSGNVTLQIFPNIRETLADGVTVVTTNTAGTFRLMDNKSWKKAADKNRMYKISFKAKEAL